MFILLLMVVAVAAETDQMDPARDQIIQFKERTVGPVGIITTSNGAPVSYPEATSTLNTRLINNAFFMDSITHVNRKIIPERVLHAKGTGAFGYFEVTHDISHICKAKFLKKVGKKTPVAVRFSTTVGERGSSDFMQTFRGFAVKFYTEDGNFDIPGINTPVFFFKDPVQFSSFVQALKKNPATNLFDSNTFWDIVTLIPASLHMFVIIFADRATPASYGNMPGYGIHTYQVENGYGDTHFLRFHILPDAGIKTLTSQEARNINAVDSDYLTGDLFRAIGKGNFPSWTVSVQILTESDVKKVGSRVFDVTRSIPLDEYPLHEIGKLVLNRNAKNFHAEIEQLAFCPANLVSGIHGGPDKLYEARRLAYIDAQLYRLGANFKKIPVNCPFQIKTFTYNRDGRPPINDNEEDTPNYYPNSFHGPVPYVEEQRSALYDVIEYPADNFDQVAELYATELTHEERTRLIENIAFSLQNVAKHVTDRAINTFASIHPDFGIRVAKALNSSTLFNAL